MDVLTVKGLTKSFGGLVAVKNVDLSVGEGEILGLIGPNGAGKTTLFNLITGFIKPDAGSIVFKGKDITRAPPHLVVRQGIARTFQLVNPFGNLSVIDNVSIPLYGKRGIRSTDKAAEIIALMKLDHRKNELAKNLPHGELKKLEIARALATEPSLLLLDEPFAGLSFEEVSELMELVKKLNDEGLTIVIVEHVMRVIMKLSHRVVVICDGEKIAEGKPLEITEDRRVIEAYLGGEVSA
ncbi:MAG: ABC transporter ATP-binding protein [Candidatus Bathyarchaeia archaeon]